MTGFVDSQCTALAYLNDIELGHIDSELRFGRADLLASTVEDIAYRRDLGDELAEGSRRFDAQHGAPELSMSVKSLEMPAYDPRGMQGKACSSRPPTGALATREATCWGWKYWGCPK